MIKKLLFLAFLFPLLSLQAQEVPLSETAELSIITIGPGAQLYDKFGHSAFRVKDVARGFDIVYNYGTYDFDTPNFYLKFAQGKLLYKVNEGNFNSFLRSYKAQNRWVKEQVLNLNQEEEQALFNFLRNNARPENAKYKYDFFFDNCATKIRDVLIEVLGKDLVYTDNFVTEQYSFRELIQKNVHWNTWGSLGMDMAIGAVVDREATPWEYQFLPNYVFDAAAEASVKNSNPKPLIQETNSLFENKPNDKSPSFFMSPLFVFGILGILLVWATFRDYKKKKRTKWVDFVVLLTTGLIGVLICLLWFGTEHSTTVSNYNLLWAFPFNVVVAFLIVRSKPKKWLYNYVFFLLLMLVLLGVHWVGGVQTFAPAFAPLFIALAIRYIYVAMHLKKMKAKVLSEV